MACNRFDNRLFNFGYGFLSRLRGRTKYRAIFKEIELPEQPKVLDVGTAYGAIFQMHFPEGSEIVGVDSSSKMIHHASKAANALEELCKNVHARLVEASATNLPFEDNYFDVVIDSWCLPHLVRQGIHEDALNEYKRVVSKSGTVILSPSRPWTGWPFNLPEVANQIEKAVAKTFPQFREKTLTDNYLFLRNQRYKMWFLQK